MFRREGVASHTVEYEIFVPLDSMKNVTTSRPNVHQINPSI